MNDADFIKIKLALDDPNGPAGESLWAQNLGGGFAKVDNLPFFTDLFTLGSVVAVDESGEVVAVKSHAYAAAGLLSLTDNEDATANGALFARLEAAGIAFERGFGAVACAVPADSIATYEEIAGSDPAVEAWSYEVLPTAPYRT